MAAQAIAGSLKWSAVLALAVVALVTLSLSLPEEARLQMPAMTLAALAIGGGLIVVVAHDRPFPGDAAARPARLVEAMAVLPETGAPAPPFPAAPARY